jgi:hypothetical protein
MSRIIRKDSSRLLVVLLAVLLSSILVSGCQGSGSTTPTETEGAGLVLEKADWGATPPAGASPTIEASVRNSGKYKLSYAEVAFVVMDKDGNQLDTVSSSTTDLEPNAVWKVAVAVISNDRPCEATRSVWFGGETLTFKLGHLTGHR